MKKFKKIYIEITNICNKNCSFCSIDNRPKKQMSLEEIEHILKEIKPFTNYVYLHVKGEPLIHHNLKEILDLCTKYNILVNITTNGTLIKEKSNILISSPCVRQINISLHSFEDDKTSEYINNILEAVTKIKDNSKIIIVYRFWALKNNNLTVENKKILNSIINYYNLDKDIVAKIMSDTNIKIASNLYINKAPLFKWPNINDKEISNQGFCYGMSRHIGILSDGTVIPCCLDSQGIINLGNIFQTPLEDILKSERAMKLLKGFRNGQLKEELCKKCQYRTRFKRNVV